MNESTPVRARFGPFLVDEAQARLSRDGARVDLPPRAMSVLVELVRRPNQLVPDEILLDRVWGHRHVSESVVRTVVSHLRQALGDDPRNPRYVETASRRGYRFVAEVQPDHGAAVPTTLPLAAAAVAPRTSAHSSMIVGRQVPSRLVHQAWQRATAGSQQIVFVGGEAGIGKSALVDDFLATLPEGTAVARSQCVEHYGPAEPYMPLLEALNALCRTAVGTTIRARLPLVAPTWLLQMPWLMDADSRLSLRQEIGTATQDRMLRELGELLDRSGDAAPVVVVFEDLHWSDHATVQALAFMAHRRTASPLLILGTFRPTELIIQQHPLAALRHELKLRRLCEEITLDPLSQSDLGDWLEHRFGARAPDDFVQALHDCTSGLPLFAMHVIEEWTAAGAIGRAEDGWHPRAPADMAVPGSIVQTIEQHIARLTPGEQKLLGAASVGGVEFSSLCLADVLGREPRDVAEELETLAGRVSWLRATDVPARRDGRLDMRYAFRHSVYRQAILQALSWSQSIPWHRAWAGALERHHEGDPAELAAQMALHLERAREPAAAAARLVDVARRAIERGAPEEAIRSARHGLMLLSRVPYRQAEQMLRVLEALALTRIHVVSTPEVADAFERTCALDDIAGPARLAALHGRWWVRFSRGQFDAARRIADAIRQQADESGDPVAAAIGGCAAGMTLAMEGGLQNARTALAPVLSLRAGSQAPTPLGPFVQEPTVDGGAILALVTWIAGDFSAAREQAQRAIDLALALRHPLSEVSALYLAAAVHALAGEFGTVDMLVRRLHGVIERHALSTTSSGFDWLRGRALVAQGRHDEGLAQMRGAAESALRCGLLVTLDGFHYHHADACLAAGQPQRAEASARDGLALAETAGMRLLESALWRQLALALLAQGDRAGAESAGVRAVEVAQAQGAGFLEMQARAAARAHGWQVREPERLSGLLAASPCDPSPVLVAIRAQLA
jgi:DNA-binding winged helix-turn-helix (wHTH) protein/tetratricopeptide (TPR) repeat protein